MDHQRINNVKHLEENLGWDDDFSYIPPDDEDIGR